jgi:hypothetical protein
MVKDPVSSLELVAITADGRRLELSVRIGRPRQLEGGEWDCPVELSPVYGQLGNIRGVDSFHALWLACSLVLKLLESFRASGGKLQDREGGEFPLEGYLAGLGGGGKTP